MAGGAATSTGATAGFIAGSTVFPFIGSAAGAAIGAFIGGVIDLAGQISDALSSVATFFGFDKGPGSNRTSIKEALAPVLANAIAHAPPENYWPAVLATASFLKQTIVPTFDVVARFSDDPTFVDDTMAEITGMAPPPPGAPSTLAAYFASLTRLPPFVVPPASKFAGSAATSVVQALPKMKVVGKSIGFRKVQAETAAIVMPSDGGSVVDGELALPPPSSIVGTVAAVAGGLGASALGLWLAVRFLGIRL